jgi:tetratricopeptide (TPR) repeat protein
MPPANQERGTLMTSRLLVAAVVTLAGATATAQPARRAPAAPAFVHVPLTASPPAQARVWRAIAALHDGLPDVARRDLNEALRLQPDMVVAHIYQGLVAKRPGELKQHLDAAANFAKAQKLKPWEKILLQIAQDRYLGKHSAMLKRYDALVKSNPNEPWFYVFRGVALRELDLPLMTEKARVDFEKAVTLWPGCRAGWNLLGYTLVSQGKIKAALNALTRYVQLSPNLANPHDSLAEVLLRAKRFKDAEAEYRTALRLDPAFQNSRIGLGYTLVNRGLRHRGPAATTLLTQGHQELELAVAKSSEPRIRRLGFEMMTVSYLLEAKPGQAVAILERYEQWAKQHNNPQAVADAQMYSAMVHAILGFYRHAYTKADEAAVTVQDPRVSPSAKESILVDRAVIKALVLLELGEPAAAQGKLKPFAKAAAQSQKVKEMINHLKSAALLFKGDPKKAIAAMANATEDQPMVLYYLGRAQLKAGDPGARATLERLASSTVLSPWSGLWRYAATETLRTASR